MFAVKLGAEGAITVVTPRQEGGSIMGWLQEQVGGYVETIKPRLINGADCLMVVNEEGKMKGLDFNRRASRLMPDGVGFSYLVGDCILIKETVDQDGESFLAPLSAVEVNKIVEAILHV